MRCWLVVPRRWAGIATAARTAARCILCRTPAATVIVPLCQGQAAREWLEQQQRALLPVPYFHVVFTLPHVLNPLIRQNQRALYTLLFQVVSQTLLQFGQNRFGVQLGITAVLHTWSQTLLDHYHLHCIVTGGGLSSDNSRWVSAPAHYLFPVRALSEVYRGKFLSALEKLYAEGKLQFEGQLAAWAAPSQFAQLLRQAARQKWVVYAKRPFAGPLQVLTYLSRYTHRVAISPRRLLATGLAAPDRDLCLERLRRRQQAQNHDAGGQRVPAPVLSAPVARALRQNPALRVSWVTGSATNGCLWHAHFSSRKVRSARHCHHRHHRLHRCVHSAAVSSCN